MCRCYTYLQSIADCGGEYIGIDSGEDHFHDIGARVGVPVSPQALLYAKGGYTNARFGLDADDGAGFNEDFSATLDGFRVGAGVEYLFGTNVYGKVEYRYSNYSSLKYNDTLFNDSNEIGVDLDRHQVVAGVGFRF